MFRLLRDKRRRKKMWIILTLLILPGFVLWGSGSVARNRGQATYAGKIFGKKITFLEYKDALNAVKNQAVMQYGDKFSEVQKNLNLEAQAWQRLLLLYEAKKRRIRTTDSEIIEQIKKYPFFQRKGQFDDGIYEQLVQYVFRTQSRVFEEEVRDNLTIIKLFEQVTKSIEVTDEEVKLAYRKNNEEVSFFYIVSQYSDFIKDQHPSDEEIMDYFTKNALQFKQPLSFNLEYIAIATEGKNENAVQEILKGISGRRLNKHTDLVKLAKDFNLSVKETGLFGQTEPIPGIGWSPEILNFIFKANPPDLLPLLYIDKNYYIIRLKEKKEPFIPDFTAIKDTVRDALVKERAEGIAKQKIDDCLKKLREDYAIDPKAVDFDKTAKIFGLKSGATDLFRFGSYIEGIGASDLLWISAQNLKEGEISEAIAMPSGFYIIRLKSRVAIDEKKFDEEKQKFSQDVLLQKKMEYFTKFITELQQKARLY